MVLGRIVQRSMTKIAFGRRMHGATVRLQILMRPSPGYDDWSKGQSAPTWTPGSFPELAMWCGTYTKSINFSTRTTPVCPDYGNWLENVLLTIDTSPTVCCQWRPGNDHDPHHPHWPHQKAIDHFNGNLKRAHYGARVHKCTEAEPAKTLHDRWLSYDSGSSDLRPYTYFGC